MRSPYYFYKCWIFLVLVFLQDCLEMDSCPVCGQTFQGFSKQRIYARIQLLFMPKISENKTCSQNFDHEGIKFHQPNFFQTSSDMSSCVSESFINLGRYLDRELIFWMKLVPPKKRTKISHFSSTFFVFAKFSGRRSWSWVFKLFQG